jgi:5-oxopent-3-ene-1,2,5-tricarboxylate decarboxylase / 2-hydroxyhepta-2,4-diene-1,7-dioate isomerase
MPRMVQTQSTGASTSTPLAGLTTGTIVYVLETRLNVRNCFLSGQIRPVTQVTRFAGHARTLRTLPTRSDVVEAQRAGKLPNAHRQSLDEASPGDVLVIDARGITDAAVMGDVLCSRFQASGGAGVVTDGCVRDLPGLVKLNFPVFAAGVHASTFGNRHVGIAVGEPVACGGVLIMPGDAIVGDEEGVVVVPAHLEEQVAQLARAQDELDNFSLEKIREGVPLKRAYPLDAELRAEFERTRQG